MANQTLGHRFVSNDTAARLASATAIEGIPKFVRQGVNSL
jgi:hypothetical protein